jgi:hypothetical protein
METSVQYREFASLCAWLANQAGTEHHQSILNEMAEAWRELADEAEREGHGFVFFNPLLFGSLPVAARLAPYASALP